MTEIDEEANLGRIAKRYAEGKEKLGLCREEAGFHAHVFERLYQAFSQGAVTARCCFRERRSLPQGSPVHP